MYHIYHVPGVKYGMTNDYPQRCLDQGFTNYELAETHTDMMIGSEREKQLNLAAGYPWNDGQYYYLMVERGSIGGNKRAQMLDMKGDQQREAWINLNDEDYNIRCSKISEGKKGVSFSNEHKQALSRSKVHPPEVVDSIRNDLSEGILSCRAIARKHNVSCTSVYNIRDRKKGYQ